MSKLIVPIIVIGLAIAAVPARAQAPDPEPKPGTLTVKGVGEVDAKPDTAILAVGVKATADSLDEAVSLHGPLVTKGMTVLQGLAAQGLSIDQSTFALGKSVQPYNVQVRVTDDPQAKPFKPTYTAQTIFVLKLSRIDDLNAIVGTIAKSGLFEVGSVQFKSAAERDRDRDARRAAVADAREQAETYAEAGQVKLLDVSELTDDDASPVRGQYDLPLRQSVDVVPPTTLHFTKTVTITWRIAPR